MTPLDRIREFYQLHPQEDSFECYLNWHLKNGFVFSTPEFFVMGRAIHYTKGKDELNQFEIDFFKVPPREFQNCWYVHAMAGDIEKVWSILPYPLGYVAFERTRDNKRELTVLQTERIRRLSHELSQFAVASA